MKPRTPLCTVDLIIRLGSGIVLVRRKHEPLGWALPGGFVDEGERVAAAARREAKEETGLDVQLERLLGVYSDPGRDPRGLYTVSTVFVARAEGEPRGADDAAEARVFELDALPSNLVFDHGLMVQDYLVYLQHGTQPLDR